MHKKLLIDWEKPDIQEETGEYFENQLTKDWLRENGIVFETEQELIEAFSKGNLETITLRQLENANNLTMTPSEFDLDLLDSEYRKSFESMETKLMHEGEITLPAPIILYINNIKTGEISPYYGFAGNRRMNLAFKYGLPLKAWIVRI